MKKKNFILVVLLFAVTTLLPSCATALKGIPTANVKTMKFETPIMEFIGFKTQQQVTTSVSASPFSMSVEQKLDLGEEYFGERLQALNIATNRQNFYMGLFSLQELDVYKSSKRYITFIDVLTDEFYQESYCYSWLLSPLGKFNKTTITLNAEYRIYVYDSQKKEIVFTKPIKIFEKDTYKGCYGKSSSSEQDKILLYYNTLFSNMLIEAYTHAYNYLISVE